MKRGGRRGRGGRGGFSSCVREWAGEGVERHGPVTEERPLYPASACSCPPAPPLRANAAALVLIRRLLTNYWRSSECFVSAAPAAERGEQGGGTAAQADVITYASAFERNHFFDLDQQKERIVSLCGKQFFPAELLQTKLLPRQPRTQGRGLAGADARRRRLHEMEQKETESRGAEEKQKTQGGTAEEKKEEDLFSPEEQEDFGGDDYAHDYYADEDLDDHLDEGDDGGVF
eukprot:XP_028343287.1 uncharacterized protein LOC114485685 [Physeter catodon]